MRSVSDTAVKMSQSGKTEYELERDRRVAENKRKMEVSLVCNRHNDHADQEPV